MGVNKKTTETWSGSIYDDKQSACELSVKIQCLCCSSPLNSEKEITLWLNKKSNVAIWWNVMSHLEQQDLSHLSQEKKYPHRCTFVLREIYSHPQKHTHTFSVHEPSESTLGCTLCWAPSGLPECFWAGAERNLSKWAQMAFPSAWWGSSGVSHLTPGFIYIASCPAGPADDGKGPWLAHEGYKKNRGSGPLGRSLARGIL